MFARVVTVHMKTDYLDEAIRIYEESVVGFAREQEGFNRVWLLSDRGSGKIYSISVWDNKEDMFAGERSSYLRDQFAKLAGFFAKEPVTEHFEVVVEG